MKALSNLKSAINQGSALAVMSLIGLLPLLYPHSMALAAGAQTSGQSAVVFNINLQNQNSLSFEQIKATDPLVVKVREYLEDHGSPLADITPLIVTQSQWQRALAISFVESNFGQFCVNNNCSGMGGAPGTKSWRKYQTKGDWFIDLNNLLDTPMYSQKYTTFEQMKGIYVYPGSNNWVYGANKVYGELMDITKQADLERALLAHKTISLPVTDLAMNTK